MAGNLRAFEERGQGISPLFTFSKGSPALAMEVAPAWLLLQLQWGSRNPFLPALSEWERLPSV